MGRLARNTFAAAAAAVLVFVVAGSPVSAASAVPAPAGASGYDISYPQCPSNFPTGGSFGIVGVNNGLPWSTNPCLSAEYTWAQALPYAAALYINTANPGPISTHWNLPGPRNCVHPKSYSDTGCAYNYGWNAALQSFLAASTALPGTTAKSLGWWLDVELANSWSGTFSANAADIQGSIDYLRAQSVSAVGIYSTSYQWGQITGGYIVPAPAPPDWVPGASSVAEAASFCDPSHSFSGGPVQLTQYPYNGFDADYVCNASSVADFSLSATPSSRTVTLGQITTYTVNITPSGGFNGPVNLGASGTPSGASAAFNPNNTTGSSSTMTVTTSSTTPTGSYALTITGVSSSLTRTTTVTLVVQAAPTPDFSIAATPSGQTVIQGASTIYTATVTPSNGFTGTVTFSVSGVPSGGSGSFNPTSVTTSGNSTLTVTTSTTTPAGSYPLTITGASGSLSRTTSVTLVVQAAPKPDFSLSVSPSSQTVIRGAGTSYTVNITPSGGFTGGVTLSASGLPSGATASFSPSSATSSSTMSVTASSTTPAGTYVLTITGVNGSMTHTTTVTLVVQAAGPPPCDGQCNN